jgi:hypothetical protein
MSNERFNFMLDPLTVSSHRSRQGVLHLQVHPELRRGVEVPSKPYSNVCCDAATLKGNIIDSRRRHLQVASQCSRGNAQGLQVLFPQNFARMYWAHSVNNHGAASLVVIDDFNFSGASIRPHEADPPLIIDPDAMLTIPVAMQWL